ncbi:hypothetical protein BKA70DRAFT_1348484 [Coprinopsis sp. MPI-PUGE-AT-0042]|nr:hypothetical protein BKA70DRAFT_1348484 [Coprinopsis sp. MPI-PUGE-AT-0042]
MMWWVAVGRCCSLVVFYLPISHSRPYFPAPGNRTKRTNLALMNTRSTNPSCSPARVAEPVIHLGSSVYASEKGESSLGGF